jgi:hypothetical protein
MDSPEVLDMLWRGDLSSKSDLSEEEAWTARYPDDRWPPETFGVARRRAQVRAGPCPSGTGEYVGSNNPVETVLVEPPRQERRATVMTTSPNKPSYTPSTREPLRLRLGSNPSLGSPDGAWWPQSRDLQTEAADLVDHFPESAGHIYRLLFSRPDWDSPTPLGRRGVRRIVAARGPVKVGSFPSDDTQLMILSMASGRRLKLQVIPSDSSQADGERLLYAAGEPDTTPGDGEDWDRWDDEAPRS